MRKQIAAISALVLLATVAGPGSAQVGGRQGAVGQSAAMPGAAGGSSIDMKIVDPKGQPIRVESLPKEVQADVERVRRAAESLAAPPAGGAGAARIKVTVSCSYPPLNCTITIQF